MSGEGGETRILFGKLLTGDSLAEDAVFQRYLERLLALAHSRMSPKLRTRLGEDDVVQSVYRSFFTRAREGKIILERSGDLWRLLAVITLNKVRSKADFHKAAKRNTGVEKSPESSDTHDGRSFVLSSGDPTPEEVAVVEEEVHLTLQTLPALHRQMIEMRLRGDSVEEISVACARTEHQVRRVLNKVRDELEKRFQHSSE